MAGKQEKDGMVNNLRFGRFYDSLCGRIRAEGSLDGIINEFSTFSTDADRISYVWQLPEADALSITPRFTKNSEEALSYEALYDELGNTESTAQQALQLLQQSIFLTPINENKSLAKRYSKRAWIFFILENFENAEKAAKQALELDQLLWVAHEILGHCFAKNEKFTEAHSHLMKALEGLKLSSEANAVKACAAGRISTVLKVAKSNINLKDSSSNKHNNSKKHKNQSKGNSVQDPKLSYGSHSKLKNCSASVSVVNREDKGRCMVANRDIQPGTIVIIDFPYVYNVNADELDNRCCVCAVVTPSGIPCDNCDKVQYCSKDCQLSKATHDAECSVLPLVYDSDIGKMAPLVYRILSKTSWEELKKMQSSLADRQRLDDIENQNDSIKELELEELSCDSSVVIKSKQSKWKWDGEYIFHNYLCTFYQITNHCKRSFGDLFKRSLSAVYLTKCLLAAGYFNPGEPSENDLKFVASLMLRHLQSCSCNAYEISEMEKEGESKEIGGAVYPSISLTNHSCHPNVARHNIGTKCVLTATRFIGKGDEVLDNYGPQYTSTAKEDRLKYLQQHYIFHCQCVACYLSWPTFNNLPQLKIRCSCGDISEYETSNVDQSRKCCGKNPHKDMVNKQKMYDKAFQFIQSNEVQQAVPMLEELEKFCEDNLATPCKFGVKVQALLKYAYGICRHLSPDV